MKVYLSVTILAAVLAVCFMVRVWRVLNRERAENRRLRSLLQLSDRMGQAELENIRRLRHDLRHYLHTANEFSPLDGTLEQLSQVLERSIAAYGPEPALTALVDHYRGIALDLGIQTDLLLQLTSEGSMLPDLYLLVSNLLENAVEALQREGRGWLRARSMSTDGYISLVVGNSCSSPLHSIGGRYLSSKSPHRLGIGLDTVERISRKYGGQAKFTCKNGEFRASVFLLRLEPDPSSQEEPVSETAEV